MPRIFDNIEFKLLSGLENVLSNAEACSFCVGYLNLRGWDQLADLVERLPGGDENRACRILVGMHRPPEEEMKALAGLHREQGIIDGPTRFRLERQIIDSFKKQLVFGIPSNQAESALRQLAAQLRKRKVFLRAFLRYPLHAKLYLIKRQDPATPLIAFVGSSNLTLAGLSQQGELNVDVVDQDAAAKLLRWFDERWRDEFALDISEKLAELIEKSWARTELVRPYLVYLKMAYHLSEEAQAGEKEFRIPKIFEQKGTPLLDFQEKAVSLAVHHLYRRGGVLLGDVVGLGKTLMATAVARIFQEDSNANTLVVCPPKLVPLWERHFETYEINGKVLSIGKVSKVLARADAPRYRLLIIDESHNLRNREGERYRAIRGYIEQNEPHVVLVTATPYNKEFTDLSNQLRLFLNEDQDLRVRPERFFQEWAEQGKNEADFIAQYQTSPRSLRAFERSDYPEDWRDLMRLFLVRRTRQFIMKHYAKFDPERQRYYVSLNGRPHYFPIRAPKRISFQIREDDPNDQYARLFCDEVVQVIEDLQLPRYGLAQYLVANANSIANPQEKQVLVNLNRAGRRLIGFCRTNLFKRLESSGYSFLLSLDRHILRNYVALHALEEGLPVPIGTQDAPLLDPAISDEDEDYAWVEESEESAGDQNNARLGRSFDPKPETYRQRAKTTYSLYREKLRRRFDWLDPKFFRKDLKTALSADAEALRRILEMAGEWDPAYDAKLDALADLVLRKKADEKIIIFSQFADTAQYLMDQLAARGLSDGEIVTSDTWDPVSVARRFSPSTNGGLNSDEAEIRVLIATDVLAEGQNLQDGHIVVNYDLPWAIIRLIQRAGRVDRIGQKHDTVEVYSFLPADGVERIIHLRSRLFKRLEQNQEVLGTDETFFGEEAINKLRDLYTEKAGILDDDRSDEDIDLASLAFQIWNSASKEDQNAAKELPDIISATRALPDTVNPAENPPGVITYLKYPDGADALVRVDEKGNLVSHSLSAIFRAAACAPDTPPLPRAENHHDLVRRCVEIAAQEQTAFGGQLGSLRSTSRKVYERLKTYRQAVESQPTLFSSQTMRDLDRILDLLFRYPLKEAARDALSRQIRLGITDEALAELVVRMASEGRLCEITDSETSGPQEPRIVCSLGLKLPPKSDES